MYKQIFDRLSNSVSEVAVLRLTDNAFIPFNPELSDYQAYLKWLEEGNTPEPADQGVQE